MQDDINPDEIIIDKEFQMLLPPLEESVFLQIEQSVLEHGIRDPLVLWNGILIDGYNRYKISQTHNLSFNTVSMEFPSRDEVTIWIIKNQNERRNLTPMQHRFYRGLHYHTEKRIITNAEGRNQHNEVDGQSDHQPKTLSTSARLARQYNVSPKTIRRDAQLATAILAIGKISPETKRDILAEKIPVSRKKLRELSAGSEEKVALLVTQIKDGTFEKKKPSPVEPAGLEKEFRRLTNDFYFELRNYSMNGDTASFRVASGLYINMLEDLFRQI